MKSLPTAYVRSIFSKTFLDLRVSSDLSYRHVSEFFHLSFYPDNLSKFVRVHLYYLLLSVFSVLSKYIYPKHGLALRSLKNSYHLSSVRAILFISKVTSVLYKRSTFFLAHVRQLIAQYRHSGESKYCHKALRVSECALSLREIGIS